MSSPSSIIIFLGPTLTHDEARRELDATYLPPAAQGDILHATRKKPSVIGLIDGYFERVPAVWHKEILWALSRGIHVFGAASLGALRAAELEMFGMRGVGRIFEDFQAGRLRGDDEVAMTHAPEALRYEAGSEAMVNIRATLANASSQGVLSTSTHALLIQTAQELFYPLRDYANLLRLARGKSKDPSAWAELEAFSAWLPDGRRDQKRLDALDMLRAIAAEQPFTAEHSPNFTFQHTDAWAQLLRQEKPAAQTAAPDSWWLDELRLLGPAEYAPVSNRVWVHLLAAELARREHAHLDDRLVENQAADFARQNGLASDAELEDWLGDRSLTYQDILRYFEESALAKRTQQLLEARWTDAMREWTRRDGRYAELQQRAEDKALRLKDHDHWTLEDFDLSEDSLWRWYFEDHLASRLPQDLEGYAVELGWPNLEAFRKAVLREFSYLRTLS